MFSTKKVDLFPQILDDCDDNIRVGPVYHGCFQFPFQLSVHLTMYYILSMCCWVELLLFSRR